MNRYRWHMTQTQCRPHLHAHPDTNIHCLVTYKFSQMFYFYFFIVLPVYLLLLCSRGYPIWQKTLESSNRTSLSTLTWPFRGCFSIPHFLFFRSSRVPPSIFLTHPDQSVPCSDYSTLQIVFANFFQTAFSSSYLAPTPGRCLRHLFLTSPEKRLL